MATRNAEIVVTKRKMANVWNVGTRNESPSFIVSRHAAQRKQIASAPAEMARQTGGLWHKVSGKNRWQSTRTDFSLCSFFLIFFFYVQIIFFFFFFPLKSWGRSWHSAAGPRRRRPETTGFFDISECHTCALGLMTESIKKKYHRPLQPFFFFTRNSGAEWCGIWKKKVQDEAKANW